MSCPHNINPRKCGEVEAKGVAVTRQAVIFNQEIATPAGEAAGAADSILHTRKKGNPTMRKLLSDILHEGAQQSLSRAWGKTQAAEDFAPLSAGEYVARIVGGELFTSRTKGTAGYKLTFRVVEGDHQGRQFWHDVWLTPTALPMAKRDLAKLGVTALEQLERPLPQGIRCKVKLVLRRGDDGTEYNRVRTFEVIGIDPPEVDPFAPIDGLHSSPLPQSGEESKTLEPLAAADVAGERHDDS